jgi:hypothetical protein
MEQADPDSGDEYEYEYDDQDTEVGTCSVTIKSSLI